MADPSQGNPNTLEGTLDKLVYTNEENAWSVVRLRVEGRQAPVTAVGKLLGVSVGEHLRLSGEWVQDPKFGRQFQVSSYMTLAPSTLQGIEKYLASGLIRGIGPELAKRLVAKFGLDTLEVIENHPDRLGQVSGIGPKRRAQIREAWVEQRRVKDLMVFLQSHGVSTNLAIKMYKSYGDDALAIVRQDPFRLAREMHGVGFLTADRVAASLGLPPDAPQRSRAGLLHVLSQAADRGHLFLPRPELVERATELLGVDAALLESTVGDLAAAGDVVTEDEAVYPTALHVAETGIAQRLQALTDQGELDPRLDVDKALEWFDRRHDFELAPEQREAIRRGLTSRVLVVTGGPGTGKTTLVRGIVEILTKKQRKVLLAAPTGRAAQRLAEATGIEAKTIHRLLEYNPMTHQFERNADRPLKADLVVLDETSMLDVHLAHAVLKALPDSTRLLLVGDADQLPSVGPGRVLGDLVDSGAVDVVRLQHIFRQASRSWIVTNAHRIRQGQMPVWPTDSEPSADFFFIERGTPEAALETLSYLVLTRIPESFGFDPVEDIQVLTPMNRGILGTKNLNEILKGRLNPPVAGTPEVVRGHRSFRVGDKVMQIRNNYDLGVWNGDLGRVVAIDPDEGKVRVTFEDRTVEHDLSTLDELVPAYACSIHKSQGSEYPCVVLVLSTQHWVMLERNLLYTALTRAKRLAVIVGETRALGVAVRNHKQERRWSKLAQRLGRPQEKSPAPGEAGVGSDPSS